MWDLQVNLEAIQPKTKFVPFINQPRRKSIAQNRNKDTQAKQEERYCQTDKTKEDGMLRNLGGNCVFQKYFLNPEEV